MTKDVRCSICNMLVDTKNYSYEINKLHRTKIEDPEPYETKEYNTTRNKEMTLCIYYYTDIIRPLIKFLNTKLQNYRFIPAT